MTAPLVCTVGFDGKLPSRGDFVTAGLPLSFLKPWRAWVDHGLLASQTSLGADWLPAWLEAPIWHFACAPGIVGPDAVLGLIFPSVDRVGRHYPMTIAAVATGLAGRPDGTASRPWLEAAEAAGLDALMNGAEPQELAAALAALGALRCHPTTQDPTAWWTEGSPRVAAARLTLPGLPHRADFAAMIAGSTASKLVNDAPEKEIAWASPPPA